MIEANIIHLRDLLYELVENKRLILSLIFFTVLCGIAYNFFQIPQYSADVLLRIEENEASNINNLPFRYMMLSENKNAAMYSALLHSRYILTPTIHALGLDILAKPDEWPVFGGLLSHHQTIQVTTLIVPPYLENKSLHLVMNAPQHFRLYNKNQILLEGEVGRLAHNADNTLILQVKQLQGKIGSRFLITKQADDKIIEALLPNLTVKDLGSVTEKNEKTGILKISYMDKNPTRLMDILNTAVRILQEKIIEQKSIKTKETLNFLQKQLPLTKQSLETAETVFNQYRAASKKLDIKAEMQFLLYQLADIDKQLTKLHLNRRALLRENTTDHPFIHEIDEKTQSLLLERKQLEAKLTFLPASDQIAVNLMRDIKVKHELYLVLLKKVLELKVEEASASSDVQILSLAQLPHAPLSQPHLLVLLGSAALGFLLSCLIVYGRKILFPKVNDAYWIERQLGVANVAVIPYSHHQKTLLPKKLLACEYPRDLALEALRGLRTGLQVSLCQAPNNIISILGLTPNIGKSFIAINLAYLFAEAGKRILLIDSDLRRGHIQNYFEVKSAPGLTEVINNTHTLNQALHVTQHPNLTLLPAGTYSTHPSELLMSERCHNIIQALSSQYDMIILETTPLLTVTDAAIISRFSATNFLVVGADLHPSMEIELAIKQLSHANIKLQGFIYNHLKKERGLSTLLRHGARPSYLQAVNFN